MDPELDDLLDDALADFDKPTVAPETAAAAPESSKQSESLHGTKQAASGADMAPPSDLFKQFFDSDMTKRLEQEWHSAMAELKDDDPALAAHFENLSTTLDTATDSAMSSQNKAEQPQSHTAKKDETSEPIDLEKIMKDTISGLGKSADEIKNMSKDEAEEKLFSEMKNLGLGGDFGNMMGGIPGMEGDFMQMMEGMMQNLLSKDVLYPTMKEISKSYPEWLHENETKLSKDELARYKKQERLINRICESFEAEQDNDAQEVKRKRLNEMMLLVEQMQECGNPPQDLIEKCASGSSVDVEKFFGTGGEFGPNLFKPGEMNPNDCSVM